MKNRALYSLIPLVVLVGCSHFRHDSGDKGYQGTSSSRTEGSSYKCFEREKCRVTVVVTACSAGGITAHPNTLKVAPKVGRVPIVWTLRAPDGFAFAADGVGFKNKEMAMGQFRSSKASSHEFVWEDQNTAPGTFPYNIKVTKDGRDCPVHDPIVVNDDTNDSP